MATLPTMKDVARRAGVHPSTVSLTLSNSPRVLPATRKKVLKAVSDLGYRPNPYISALMRNRRQGRPPAASATLALLSTFPTPDGCIKEFPFMESAFAAAKRQAEMRGFHLDEIWAPLDKMKPDRVSRILHARNITGIVLAPFPRAVDNYPLEWDRFAVVAWGMSLSDPHVHHVRSNHFGCVTRAMDECHKLGYRRIGLAMMAEANRRMGGQGEAAYLWKQREFGIVDPPAPYLPDELSQPEFMEWFRRERPDVVMCYTRWSEADESQSESGFSPEKFSFEWLQSEGIRVPEDVGVASLSCARDGTISGVVENWDLQAIRGVNLLIGLLADNELGSQQYPNMSVVEVGWNPGETLRRVGG